MIRSRLDEYKCVIVIAILLKLVPNEFPIQSEATFRRIKPFNLADPC